MKDYSIFLLEPDNLIREAFLDVLEEEGYTLYPLENPWQTISFIKKVQFQIAIIDSSLGDFKIRDLISEINKINPKPSIIVTTTKPEVEDVLSFYNSGAEAVLIKPVCFVELKEALERSETAYEDARQIQILRRKISELEQEKSKIEESLKKAAANLPFAELAGSLTHEIKNALTTINLSLHFIKKNVSLDDSRIIKHFELINQSVSFANELVMKLLGLTRERKEQIDFNSFISSTLEILEPDLGNRGIRVLKSFREDLPKMLLDVSTLRQVLINIILNAKEAMKEGGQLQVKTYMEERDKSYLVIELTDTGIGIAPENLDKIFLPSYSTKEKGTGLGLYISKRIIEDMAGKIEVASTLGKGSRFKIMLPYSKEELILRKKDE